MSESTTSTKPDRLLALDAYRGFVMLGLVTNYFGLFLLGGDGSAFARFCEYQTSHVAWSGCSLWDLIQPSFMFIVGVAMPYSYASRQARGDTPLRLTGHVLYRAMVLILLGLFLRSNGRAQTNFTFEDVVTQIGLGYIFVYMLLGKGIRVQAIATGVILIGYWLLFALWPLPGAGVDAAALGLPADWQQFTGFAAHWNKGLNPCGYFDHWFLNLFPRPEPYTFHSGGYGTLSFIPSMATMLFGVMTGELLRGARPLQEKVKLLVLAGAACLGAGLLLDGHIWPVVHWDWAIAPIVKRIWTPSWAIFAAGWTLWMLAAFLWVIDVKGYRRWTFPLIVVGMNSIAMYVMHGLLQHWVAASYDTHFGLYFGGSGAWAGMREGLAALTLWYICYWMYKKRLFIRI